MYNFEFTEEEVKHTLKDDRISLVNNTFEVRPTRNHFASQGFRSDSAYSGVNQREDRSENKSQDMTFRREDEETAQIHHKMDILMEQKEELERENRAQQREISTLTRKIENLEKAESKFTAKIESSLILVSELQKRNEFLRKEVENSKKVSLDWNQGSKEKTIEVLRSEISFLKAEIAKIGSKLDSDSGAELIEGYMRDLAKAQGIVCF